MGMGPRTNVYNIGGEPLTQKFYIFEITFFGKKFFKRNADREKMNGKYFVGDPLTHLCNQSNIAA